MTVFLDTNVVVRHLTGDPPAQAKRATRLLREAELLVLPDLIVAEIVYVMGSLYRFSRTEVARALRAVIGFNSVVTTDRGLLLRALDIYEAFRIGFPDAYLVASAESSGVGAVASFDKGIDRVGTVRRVEHA